MCSTEVHFRPQSHQWAPTNKLSYVSQGQGLCMAPKLCLCSWSVSRVKWQREAFQCHCHDSTATHMGSIIADSFWCKEYWMFSPFLYLSLMHVCMISTQDGIFETLHCFVYLYRRALSSLIRFFWLQMKQQEKEKVFTWSLVMGFSYFIEVKDCCIVTSQKGNLI